MRNLDSSKYRSQRRISNWVNNIKVERNKMTDSLVYQDYTATINYSADDNVYFGKIMVINDLISFEGSSIAELNAAFHESV